jgi:hypothetical protein
MFRGCSETPHGISYKRSTGFREVHWFKKPLGLGKLTKQLKLKHWGRMPNLCRLFKIRGGGATRFPHSHEWKAEGCQHVAAFCRKRREMRGRGKQQRWKEEGCAEGGRANRQRADSTEYKEAADQGTEWTSQVPERG